MTQTNPELIGDRCAECNGSGTIFAGIFEVDCPDCVGTGLINSPNACTECKGSGTQIANAGGFRMEADCTTCKGRGLKPVVMA